MTVTVDPAGAGFVVQVANSEGVVFARETYGDEDVAEARGWELRRMVRSAVAA